MIKYLQVLLFVSMIPKQYMKIVNCDDTLRDLGWIIFESPTKTICDDDVQADYSG